MKESESLQYIVQGYSSDSDATGVVYESEDWDNRFGDSFDGGDDDWIDSECDDASQNLTVTKKGKVHDKLQAARDAKKRKSETQQNFAELFDEGEVLTTKSDIFTRAMQNLI